MNAQNREQKAYTQRRKLYLEHYITLGRSSINQKGRQRMAVAVVEEEPSTREREKGRTSSQPDF